ncbi:MAG TPA: helix-turn-helix transcriptional regulator [Azospirillaceae bacterium]|nr:helix-turn-helix transcriptional regulator [Azospirillaceae bacterium]
MFTHGEIWTAIDRLAKCHGMTVSALARRGGLDPTAFNRSKRLAPDGRPRWPSTESIAKVLAATGSSLAEFAVLTGRETSRLPVIGLEEAAQDGRFDAQGRPAGTGWGTLDVPWLPDARAFALRVTGTALEPVYRGGDHIVLSPAAPARPGDRVAARTRGGAVLVGRLAARTALAVEIGSFDPARPPHALAPAGIDWLVRIVWASQ